MRDILPEKYRLRHTGKEIKVIFLERFGGVSLGYAVLDDMVSR